MNIYEILTALIDKPDVPKFYRELKQYFENHNLTNEASAIGYLIENKFEKKHESIINNSDCCEK